MYQEFYKVKPIYIFFLLLVVSIVFFSMSSLQSQKINNNVSILYARIDGSINPAQVDLLKNAIYKCQEKNHLFLILGLDTPGGLGQSMREMVKEILNSPVPVVTWVGPKGAHAASAGVYIVAASFIAAMSPQSTIGAASPVAIGGKDISSTMAQKIKNDFLSLIRSVAKARGRNVDWYEKAVEEAVSITATEAVMLKVVDLIATTPEDLVSQISSRNIAGEKKVLNFDFSKAELVKFKPGFRYSFLSWLLNPQIAYFLLMGGIAGLFFELSNPGTIFPGVVGGICLLLALYAMAILPTNVAGLLLILLSFIFFILEVAVISFGLLTLAGIVCLFLGSTILFRFEYGLTNLPMSIILSTILAVSGFICLALYLVTKSQLRPQKTGAKAMLGLQGVVLKWHNNHGQVRIRGEIWKARSTSDKALTSGDKIKVVSMEGLILIVEPENV